MQDLDYFPPSYTLIAALLAFLFYFLYGPTTTETNPSKSQDRVRAGCQHKQVKDDNTSFLSPFSSLLKTQSD